MTTTRFRTSATAVAGMLLLAACEGSDLPGYGSGVRPSSSAAAPSGTTSGSAPADDGASFTDPAETSVAEPGGAQLLTVTDVTVEEHDGFDRVVLALDGDGTPGWRVGYVDEALDAGTGDVVPVAGDAVLEVALTGTAMPMDSGVTEYGGDPVAGTGEAVAEVVYRFVFEGTTTAFVGVTGQARPFRVQTHDDPLAVVVDVQR
jgi:hypothetical protein